METEVKAKLEVKQKSGLTLTLQNIPVRVHKALLRYQKRISADRNKDFTIKEAYVEYLKEMLK